jgi:hypothetical protein
MHVAYASNCRERIDSGVGAQVLTTITLSKVSTQVQATAVVLKPTVIAEIERFCSQSCTPRYVQL